MLQGKPIRNARKGGPDKRIPWSTVIVCLIPAVLTACSIPSVIQTAAQQIYVIAIDERPTWTLTRDKQIEVSIEKRFHDEPTVSILHISAYCYNGNVYLVGEYETAEEAMMAISLAGQTEGVKSVTPYLLVKGGTPSCGWGDDVFIHAKIKTKYIADEVIKSTNVDIKVVQCRAVLLGIVGSGVEVSRAIDLAQEVKGVIEVKSFLVPVYQEGSEGPAPPRP